MRANLDSVDEVVSLLKAHFASNSRVVIDRGLIMGDTDEDEPLHIGVSLRQVVKEEEVEGSPSLKTSRIQVLVQGAENAYPEETLYEDYVAPVVEVLEDNLWSFEASDLAVNKEGAKVNIGVRLDLSKLPDG